jgi:hypothetical protein
MEARPFSFLRRLFHRILLRFKTGYDYSLCPAFVTKMGVNGVFW